MANKKQKKSSGKTKGKSKSLLSWLIVAELIFAIFLITGIAIWLKQLSSPSAKTYARVTDLTPAKPVESSPSAQKMVLSPSAQPSATPLPIPAFEANSTSLRAVNVPILMYHYIGNNPNPADKERDVLSTAPDIFDNQLGYLSKNGFTPITLDTLYAAMRGGQLPTKPIVLTFDDGYVDFYINAFPILKKYNFHAVSFIPTSLMNQGYYMSWNQIKEIQSSGLVAFEAHSLTHADLAAASYLQAKQEIFESKKVLESEVGEPVNFFAYPYGASNSLDWGLVAQAGFSGAVGTWEGTVENSGNIFDMPRVRISGGISMTDFASKI